jgi:hypothetical protein
LLYHKASVYSYIHQQDKEGHCTCNSTIAAVQATPTITRGLTDNQTSVLKRQPVSPTLTTISPSAGQFETEQDDEETSIDRKYEKVKNEIEEEFEAMTSGHIAPPTYSNEMSFFKSRNLSDRKSNSRDLSNPILPAMRSSWYAS